MDYLFVKSCALSLTVYKNKFHINYSLKLSNIFKENLRKDLKPRRLKGKDWQTWLYKNLWMTKDILDQVNSRDDEGIRAGEGMAWGKQTFVAHKIKSNSSKFMLSTVNQQKANCPINIK